jgi:hypothetical protein
MIELALLRYHEIYQIEDEARDQLRGYDEAFIIQDYISRKGPQYTRYIDFVSKFEQSKAFRLRSTLWNPRTCEYIYHTICYHLSILC